jgi:hypothetical protein
MLAARTWSQDDKALKASKDTAELIDKVPAAVEKLKANQNNFAKLTMPEMKAIAYVRFNGAQLKGDKAAHVASMQKLLAAHPTILSLVPTATAAEVVAPAPIVEATGDSDDDSDDGIDDGSDDGSGDGSGDESGDDSDASCNDYSELELAQLRALEEAEGSGWD